MTLHASRSVILLLSLNKQPFFDEQYEAIIDQLAAQFDLKRVSTGKGAINFLNSKPPDVLLVTDEGLAEQRHAEVLECVQSYTRNGGRTIIAFHFSSFITMDKFDGFFTSWGLPWLRGNYERSDVYLNQSCASRFNLINLPERYSQKALKIKNAAKEDFLYSPDSNSRTQSMVFSPSEPDLTQAAVVFASWGAGSIAYVGDVNNDSDVVITVMCGLKL